MIAPAARRVQRAFSKAARSYDAAAEIQRRVVGELLAQLPADCCPATMLDLGCGTGSAFSGLLARHPASTLIGLDFSESVLHRAPTLNNLQKIGGNATLLPLADASVDCVFSSLALQWCPLDTALAEARRVMRPGATLAFSTLTGETFRELRLAFAGIDDAPHALPLLTPEAIFGATRKAGFSSFNTTRITHIVWFDSVRTLFDSIRQTGASEVTTQETPARTRRRGLLGKAAYARIEQRLQALADSIGRLPLTYDVLYLVGRIPETRP